MAIIDIFAGLVSKPASRVVEAPVRDLVDEILRQQDVARPHEVAQLKREIQTLGKELEGLVGRIESLQKSLDGLQTAAKPAAEPAAEPAAKPAVKATPKPAAKPAAKKATAKKPSAKKAAPKKPVAKKAVAKKAVGKRGRPSLLELGCKVHGCKNSHRSKGFCSQHYQQWRRGRLDGFVGPEGIVTKGKVSVQLDKKLSGKAAKFSGKGKALKVLVDKQETKFKLLA